MFQSLVIRVKFKQFSPEAEPMRSHSFFEDLAVLESVKDTQFLPENQPR